MEDAVSLNQSICETVQGAWLAVRHPHDLQYLEGKTKSMRWCFCGRRVDLLSLWAYWVSTLQQQTHYSCRGSRFLASQPQNSKSKGAHLCKFFITVQKSGDPGAMWFSVVLHETAKISLAALGLNGRLMSVYFNQNASRFFSLSGGISSP